MNKYTKKVGKQFNEWFQLKKLPHKDHFVFPAFKLGKPLKK